MSVQAHPPALLSGEYLVVSQGYGQGIDHYLKVTGPDGSASEQKVLWTYSKTAYQVVEEAVAGHVGGHVVLRRAVPTRETQEGGYIVTVAGAE